LGLISDNELQLLPRKKADFKDFRIEFCLIFFTLNQNSPVNKLPTDILFDYRILIAVVSYEIGAINQQYVFPQRFGLNEERGGLRYPYFHFLQPPGHPPARPPVWNSSDFA
jgi:hypothetical protein